MSIYFKTVSLAEPVSIQAGVRDREEQAHGSARQRRQARSFVAKNGPLDPVADQLARIGGRKAG